MLIFVIIARFSVMRKKLSLHGVNAFSGEAADVRYSRFFTGNPF